MTVADAVVVEVDLVRLPAVALAVATVVSVSGVQQYVSALGGSLSPTGSIVSSLSRCSFNPRSPLYRPFVVCSTYHLSSLENVSAASSLSVSSFLRKWVSFLPIDLRNSEIPLVCTLCLMSTVLE